MYPEPMLDETASFERNFNLVGNALFSIDILEANQPFVTTVDWWWVYNHPRRGLLIEDADALEARDGSDSRLFETRLSRCVHYGLRCSRFCLDEA